MCVKTISIRVSVCGFRFWIHCLIAIVERVLVDQSSKKKRCLEAGKLLKLSNRDKKNERNQVFFLFQNFIVKNKKGERIYKEINDFIRLVIKSNF